MDIRKVTILGGRGKDGRDERVREVTLEMGSIASVVGPTGCGKTTLISDLELFANGDTPTGRRILIDGEAPTDDLRSDPSTHPIALISQHTNFLSDLPVEEFLAIHARIRHAARPESVVEETVRFANELTGEPLVLDHAMTELSGGQTRALLIADAVVIGHAPIVLLDEIENAGINRTRALELLRRYRKIFVFVTHDPRIALLSDFRIVMRNGAMRDVIETGEEERRLVGEIGGIDDLLLDFRQRIRSGERLGASDVETRLRALGYLG